MAKRADDRSEAHLAWLLRSRARNMEAAKQLVLSVQTFSDEISSNVELQAMAQELTGIVFSLWRSVFLSDLTGDVAEQTADIEEFLGNLLSNNTIA